MIDVRLTATNPEDSTLVPVSCNARGELNTVAPKIEEIPNDLKIDGDLTVTGLINGSDGVGQPGPPGPPGPEGPSGTLGIQYLDFTPEYVFTDGGSAVIEYRTQAGKAYVLGDLVIINGTIATREVLITNPRGECRIKIPDYVDIISNSTFCSVGTYTNFKDQAPIHSALGTVDLGVLSVLVFNPGLSTRARDLATTDLSEGRTNLPGNKIAFHIVGRYLSQEEIARRAEARAAIDGLKRSHSDYGY